MSYIVGIDLGTTNSAVAYIKSDAARPAIRLFKIPQLVAPGEIENLDTLGSFHYTPQEGEFVENAISLPWETQQNSFLVGRLARDLGGKQPERLISSAKSWLSHTGVDRAAPILPWHGPAELERLSPAEVNARYLVHIASAWNHEFPEHPLQGQTVILTVPASYDEVARELTVEAARKAGLNTIVLLEEPQAALYHWLAKHEHDWKEICRPGQTILVCDIGGGTSDFTLIAIDTDDDGELRLQRIRIGEHLLLGGDNLDLALAHYVEEQLAAPLHIRQWSILTRACQSAKETLLGPSAPEELAVSLPQSGSSLFRNALQVTLTQETVKELLLEGFLPSVKLSDRPQQARSGFQEFGLNYAADPSISRHLAAFLASGEEHIIRPDHVLFNGGFFKSEILTERTFQQLCAWFGPQEFQAAPQRLENPDVDLAVAYGAAYYGLIRQGQGIRIHSGLLHSYYIGVETEHPDERQAVCLIPAGLTEGTTLEPASRSFKLRIRQPVEFPLYVSQSRPQDRPGEMIVPSSADIQSLPPIKTLLTSGKKKKKSQEVDVRLQAALNEIGILELWCKETNGMRKWKLEFNTRAAPQADTASQSAAPPPVVIPQHDVQRCYQLIERTFSSARDVQPQNLLKELEQLSGSDRNSWPLPFLRGLWEKLSDVESGRHLSALHESCWLNALGFCLRPGYGFQMDDWRVQKTWGLLINSRVVHKQNQACRAEWWILWRRVAGGLNANYQEALLQSCLPLLTDTKGRLQQKSKVGKHEQAEMYRAIGALELLNLSSKIKLGDMLVQALQKQGGAKGHEPLLWMLGHLGGRIPMYGPLNSVAPAEDVERWLEQLLALPTLEAEQSFPLMLLARKTGDRYRDISETLRNSLLERLEQLDAPRHYRSLIEEAGRLTDKEQRLAFGESLPSGLRIA